jgi:solute carrier family 10 (sodium/bile acid cotransporter), member 7
MSSFSRLRPDEFTIAMLATVALALLVPCRGTGAGLFEGLAAVAIALLFFLQGARLSRGAIIAGALHWRLHLVVFSATFVLFPIVGLALRPLSATLLTPPLYLGLLFLCTLPSTVQASVAFTSIAGGNVAAALCSASASSILGMFVTPLLAGLVLNAHGALSLNALRSIGLEMLLPFLAGQLLQPWIGSRIQKRRRILGGVDRGSVLLVVYTVFSGATLSGIWHQLALGPLIALFAVAGALLALMLAITAITARGLGFSRADEIAIMFCSSKKSLVTGIPMANLLFAGQALGLIILPLMVFHQIQLMACAALARHYAMGVKPLGSRAASRSSPSHVPMSEAFPGFGKRDFGAIMSGGMTPNETGLDAAKEVRPAGACCLSLPLPARTRRRVHGHLPQAAPGRYLWRNPGRSAGERAGGDRAVPGGNARGWPAHSTP